MFPIPSQKTKGPTRQNELTESFPEHVVCAWIGNSKPVAQKHYLQVTDEHYDRAANGTSAAYALQQPSEMARKGSQAEKDAGALSLAVPLVATECDSLREAAVAREGLEPPTKGL